MPRFHATANGQIPFSLEEEAARDIEEAKWASEENERLSISIRQKRDEILKESDWRAVKAAESNISMPEEWVSYRQSLRDVPQQPGFPKNVVWPQPPA